MTWATLARGPSAVPRDKENSVLQVTAFGTYGIGGDVLWVYSGASGTQVIASDGTEVPEPSTLGLLGIGLVSIARIFRKRGKHV
jgi:hypothetical protein